MTYSNSIIMGLIQGLTEFLPISSSGHLTILSHLFQLKGPILFYEIILHVGTLLAVLLYFKKQIISYCTKYKALLLIAVASIPTAIIGLLIKKYLAFVFNNVFITGLALIVTAIVLFATRYTKTKNEIITISNAFFIGVIQGCAVLPGLSRSGLTITLALFLGITANTAAEFSFIISIPAIAGATLLEAYELIQHSQIQNIAIGPSITGFLIAAVSGYISLIFLIKLLKQNKLHFFSYYVFPIALLTIFLGIL